MRALFVACRIGAIVALALDVCVGLVLAPGPAAGEPDGEWTVLTLSDGGAWGLSTARSQADAISGALRQCRSRADQVTDCGAEFVAYRVGWSEAILCGPHRVLVAGLDRDEVEAMVHARIADLRRQYGSALPSCRRLVEVDPWGGVLTGNEAIAHPAWPTLTHGLTHGDVDGDESIRSTDLH
jgi:hypothetical protein